MTPPVNATAWHAPSRAAAQRRAGWTRLSKTLAATCAALLLTQYLAGYFLLLSFHMDLRTASLLTTLRYLYYFADNPVVRHRVYLTSALSLALVGGASVAAWLPRRRALHGDARFATRGEVAAAGLLARHGLILGRLGRHYLILPGQQGVALAAPPRSGKGVGVVVPNLLCWPDSAVIADIKRENWTLTAGYRRAMGQDVHLFEPLAEDGRTAGWNCLSYVPQDPSLRINGIQRIAETLWPDPPNVDPFWSASARTLFLGVTLYVLETPSLPATLGEVLRQGMAGDQEGFGAHWRRLIEGRKAGRFPLSSQCVRALCDIIDLAPVTASSIRKTFTSRLELWLNPLIDASTSHNSFDLRDLRKRPMSIYVAVNPDDLHRLRPLLNLFFEQTLGLQTRELPEHNPNLKLQVLLMMDEFASLGRIPVIAEAASFLPGYNVRLVLIFQALSQLREVYGSEGAQTLLKSLAARIVFAPKDYPDAREISDELGFTTVKVKSISKPLFNLSSTAHKSRTQSWTEQRRALLLPQEVKELGTEHAILFYEGLRPIRCRKIRYFADRRFRRRLLPTPERAAAIDTPATQPPAIDPFIDPTPRVRNASPADIERMEQLTLDDFAIDFSKVTLPNTDGPVSEQDLQAAAESFLASLRER